MTNFSEKWDKEENPKNHKKFFCSDDGLTLYIKINDELVRFSLNEGWEENKK